MCDKYHVRITKMLWFNLGKRLKLHIDDLEKRAALVEQLPNVNVFPSIHPDGSVHDDMLEYYPFVHQMSGSAGAGWMQPLDTMTVASSQAYESSGISAGPSFPTAPSRIPDSSLTKPNCGQQQDSLGTPLKDGALGLSKASISPPGEPDLFKRLSSSSSRVAPKSRAHGNSVIL
jgi:hypothetical protein